MNILIYAWWLHTIGFDARLLDTDIPAVPSTAATLSSLYCSLCTVLRSPPHIRHKTVGSPLQFVRQVALQWRPGLPWIISPVRRGRDNAALGRTVANYEFSRH